MLKFLYIMMDGRFSYELGLPADCCSLAKECVFSLPREWFVSGAAAGMVAEWCEENTALAVLKRAASFLDKQRSGLRVKPARTEK